MYKILLKLALIISLLLNSVGQGYALRPMAAADSIDTKSAVESIVELRKVLLEGLNNDQTDVAQLIGKIRKAIGISITRLASPLVKLTDAQKEEIKNMLSEIMPILFTFGFDKQGNQLSNAFFMASEHERTKTIINDFKDQLGIDDLEALAQCAALHLTDSLGRNGVAISDLSWRAKSFYSIAAKLNKKGYNVSDMSDLVGIRFYPDIPNITPLEAMHVVLSAMPEDWQLLELQRVSYVMENGEYQRLNLQLLVGFLWKLDNGKSVKVQLQIRYKNSFTLDSVYNPVYKKQLISGLPAELTGITELNWKRGEYYYRLEKENPGGVQMKLITEIRARWKIIQGKKLLQEEGALLEEINQTERSDFKPVFNEANIDGVVMSFKPLGSNTDIQIPIHHILSVEEVKKHRVQETGGILYFVYQKGNMEVKFEVRGSKDMGSAKLVIVCQRNKTERFVYFTDSSPKILIKSKVNVTNAVASVYNFPASQAVQAVLSAA